MLVSKKSQNPGRALRKSSARTGATAVEVAFLLPFFFLLVFAIFEYSRYELLRQLIISASREGARRAVVGGNQVSEDDIEQIIRKRLVNQDPKDLAITVYKCDAAGKKIGTWSSAASGDLVAIEVKGSYDVMLPSFGILPDDVPVVHKTVMLREVN